MIDSFPLAVYKFVRARYCRSFRSYGADYGKCPSKKETYLGYKVHVIITLEGYITSGIIKGFRIGYTWKVSKTAVDLYIQEKSVLD